MGAVRGQGQAWTDAVCMKGIVTLGPSEIWEVEAEPGLYYNPDSESNRFETFTARSVQKKSDKKIQMYNNFSGWLNQTEQLSKELWEEIEQ